MVSLFDRPAQAALLNELKLEFGAKRKITALEQISQNEWLDAISDLRAVRLLSPADRSAPDNLDTHPLIRDWFSSQMQARDPSTWQSAHRRLYESLKANTSEGSQPTLASLQPLYQAISHGCKAGQYEDALKLYNERIARHSAENPTLNYSALLLGATSTDVATLSQFFETPFEHPKAQLSDQSKRTLIAIVSAMLANLGRLKEAVRSQSSLLRDLTKQKLSLNGNANAASLSSNLATNTALLGNIPEAIAKARSAITFARKVVRNFDSFSSAHTAFAFLQFLTGKIEESRETIDQVEKRRRAAHEGSVRHLDLLAQIHLYEGNWQTARALSDEIVLFADQVLFLKGAARLIFARATFGDALERSLLAKLDQRKTDVTHLELASLAENKFNEAIMILSDSEQAGSLAMSYINRATFRISQGNWELATNDLNEAEEIVLMSSMTLLNVDIAIQRARMAIGKMYNFAPLAPHPPSTIEAIDLSSVRDDLKRQISFASELAEKTGFKLRTAEINGLRDACGDAEKIAKLVIRV
jgi:tetratricopeptide (TPR) repeat protein